jgi:isoleucyl-tRNA synthetase
VCPIDNECRFTSEVTDYSGRFVKDCDKDIMERLKKEGKLIKREQILHAYPHCWRCGSPLIYRGIGSWFVSVEAIRDKLLAANEQIYWQPEHIKNGRFGKWLEGARDCAISRNRYWGNPIPIWVCDDPKCRHQLCVGSRAELKELSGTDCPDLHKHFVDEVTIPCPKCGKPMHRVPEVLDCWFESGAMPYAQNHYPFENKAFFEAHYPADFISEGLDQTRGWFYTLTVLAAALFDRPAFKNCVVSGIVLATDGKKMSKSLNNYTDPAEALGKFGADAIRLFLVHSAAVRADEIRYSDEGVRDVIKDILLPLWNSYRFFVTYANIDGVTAGLTEKPAVNPLDTWILSITQKLVQDFTAAMDAYDFAGAVDPLVRYIESLNNWYIRRSRRRFWKSESDSDKAEAYETLYRALKTFALVAAPVIPFVTDTMWQNLRLDTDPLSVHLADFPAYNAALRDETLEFKMDTVQKAVSLGRALRYQFSLKTRQPLKSVEFVTKDAAERNALLEMEESIREELNVKKVVLHEREYELVEYKAKANFRTLGKALGPLMKAAAEEIMHFDQASIQSILDGSVLTLDIAGTSVEIDAEKIIVERIEKANLRVINEGTLTVALDTEITEELQKEGAVRDLVRGVQNLRKESGLEVTDRIKLTLGGTPLLKEAWEAFTDFVAGELLATEVRWDAALTGGTEIETDAETWRAALVKA